MSLKRKCSISESNGNILDSDSKDSDIFPLYGKRIVIQDSDSAENNNLDPLPEQWEWRKKDNNPKIWKYTNISGINTSILARVDGSASILDVFYEILNEEFWELLVTETNRYASQKLNDENYKKKKFDDKWFPTNVHEMKAFFALCIIAAQVKKPTVQMCWTKKRIIETPIFGETMPFWRFLILSRFLHFSDNEMEENSDRLRKIRNIINYFNNKFKQVYTPEENISLSESLMKFRGRFSYVQHNPSKRTRFGIKFYRLCESNTGFCTAFKICTGQDKTTVEDSASESVIMELSESLWNNGYTLFLDKWYSSPNLYVNLHKKKINVIGTVRRNKKNMPKELPLIKLKKGEFEMRSSHGLLALRWRDKKDVYMLSTKHVNVEMVETEKRNPEKVLKPSCVCEYNKCMGAVDQYLACFPIIRKFLKGYRKIFFYVTDMAIFNAYVLYRKLNGSKKMGYVSFRIEVAEALLEGVQLPDYNVRGRPVQGVTPARLQAKHWAHFPRHIPPTEKKKNPARLCKVCTKRKKRSETTWECKQCLVALHVPECFEIYHTLKDY